MTYQAAVFDRFGGLNLSVDPSEAGSYAIDGTDFDLTPLGEVVSRAGTGGFVVPFDSPPRELMNAGGIIIARCLDVKLRAMGEGLGLVATSSAVGIGALVPFATPSGGVVYCTVGTSATTLAKWNGTMFSYPSVGYSSSYGCVQPGDNRLVLAGITTATNTVRFSDAGDAETFGTDNYVMLTPGRDSINGCCSWGNSVFVFKRGQFFEFYGNSQASDGAPIFNYRTVDTGIGIRANVTGQACVAAPDGVYFFGQDGIYRTTGGAATKVSGQIDRAFIDGDLADASIVAMGYANDRIYVSAGPTVTPTVTYVYWLETQQWMRWSLPASGWLNLGYRVFFSNYTASQIYYLDPDSVTDNETPITASYQSGFFDLGQSNLKTIRETLLTGKGQVGYQLTRDQAGFDTVPSSATEAETITLGTTAAKQGRSRMALRGAEFSYRLTGTAPWSIQRVAPGVRGTRPAGVETPA